jgi:hypothetical protein
MKVDGLQLAYTNIDRLKEHFELPQVFIKNMCSVYNKQN